MVTNSKNSQYIRIVWNQYCAHCAVLCIISNWTKHPRWMHVLCNSHEKQLKKTPEVFILHIQNFRWDLISSYEDQNYSVIFLSSPPLSTFYTAPPDPVPCLVCGHYTKPAPSSLLLPWRQKEEEIVQCFYRFLAENGEASLNN